MWNQGDPGVHVTTMSLPFTGGGGGWQIFSPILAFSHFTDVKIEAWEQKSLHRVTESEAQLPFALSQPKRWGGGGLRMQLWSWMIS